ncbi:MAG: hypothetical protein U1E76_27525 [Planctomycetota bacterium]
MTWASFLSSHRPTSLARPYVGALGLLLLAHGAIRYQGIVSNYPYLLYGDEGYVAHCAQEMYREQTLDPHKYVYNPLLMTMINVVVRSTLLFTAANPDSFRRSIKYLGEWSFKDKPPHDVVKYFDIVDPPVFLVIGRAIVATTGTMAVLAAFFLLRAFVPPWPAVAGTAFFGAIPELVLHGHYIVNDIPMMLAFEGAAACSVHWFRLPRWRRLVAVGAWVGAACSFKTTGILAAGLPLILIAASSQTLARKLRAGACLLGIVLLTFLALCPGLIGRHWLMIRNLTVLSDFYQHWSHSNHVAQLLTQRGFGAVALALASVGLFAAVIRHRHRRVMLAIGAYTVAFFLLFWRYRFQPMRSIFPILPLLTCLATYGTWALVQALCGRARRLAPWVATLVLGTLAVSSSLCALKEQQQFLSTVDTRVWVTDWLKGHVEAGESVAVAEAVALHPRAMRESGLAMRLVAHDGPEEFSSASWVVLPVYESNPWNQQRCHELAMLMSALERQGRKLVLTKGTNEIAHDERLWQGQFRKLLVFGPKG